MSDTNGSTERIRQVVLLGHDRGGSGISERGGGGGGGLLITIHEAGEGSGAEPQPPTLFYYIMRKTLTVVWDLQGHTYVPGREGTAATY